ncbi:GNAT family N-acetyltransferase [Paramagnetospirillum magneticum]|uniref:Histone acetyltransferase HPA2 and related acetyltransferase n=1 Tax=Paramagnetospirillum magneticum (strain ATCC 700264 / AMB-1) TaxID=342108 RepID=Q2W7B4_PARM1|nr:GNAT family N-acetyltransferase [Paramagnetospirillum magneticum]BAE50261.1 Histone acetyltransferase HPA2 and related acetyltransferase [Paramagnetospirillum magneticum AMB-1]
MPVPGFHCPQALAAKGYRLVAEAAEHLPFLRGLFAALRQTELAFLPFSDEQKERFVHQQFDMQRRQYLGQYPTTAFWVVGGPDGWVGRFYLAADDRGDVRILDISLAPQYRGQGIGGTLISELQSVLAPLGHGVSLHVEKTNPAQRLYQRLGFRITGDTGLSWRMDWRQAGDSLETA